MVPQLASLGIARAGRSDTGVGTSDTPTMLEVDLGVGVECRKSWVKSVASRGVGSPVLSSDTSTLSFDRVFNFFGGNLASISNCSAALCMNSLAQG